MKRVLAAILAIATLLSVSGCQDTATSSNADSNNSQTTSDNTSQSGEQTEKPLSNPVAVDEDGKVDMEVALKYETDFEALKAELEAREVDPDTPVSKNLNPEAKALFDYLKSIYGKQTLAGQQYFDAKQYEDILYINETGDLPAIKGFDLIFSTGNQPENDQHVDDAIKWHTEQNGIVTMCWHWKVPVDMNNADSQGIAFYSDEITNFSFKNAVTPGTKEYEIIIRDIDTAAIKLQKLEAAGVPVLWRPLHEASGSWFWWGVADKESQEYYQKLWYMVFDRLENYNKLTNLIWVWNCQEKKAMVNENTYDIASIDVYPNTPDYSELASSYKILAGQVGTKKMIALSECGYIPDPEKIYAETSEVKWLYYLPWNGEFLLKTTGTGAAVTNLNGTPSVNEERLTVEYLQKVYSSDKIITLSELPTFEGTDKIVPTYIRLWMFNEKDFDIANTKLKDYKLDFGE